MTEAVRYGSRSQQESRAAENDVSRQIVREISNFGINQRQTMLVIYLLAAELEDAVHMRAVTRLIRELGGDELFLIGQPEPDAEAGGHDGSTDV